MSDRLLTSLTRIVRALVGDGAVWSRWEYRVQSVTSTPPITVSAVPAGASPFGPISGIKLWARDMPVSSALQRKLLDDGDADVVAKFKAAGVTMNTVSAAELARIQDKVKSVVTKFAPVIGEDFVKQFYSEIEKARSGK